MQLYNDDCLHVMKNFNPQSTLSQTEFVLVFKKGKFPSPRGARNIKQLVSVKRTTHSTKPDEVMKCIEQMFPTQEKIELFARKKVIGWDSCGLEI